MPMDVWYVQIQTKNIIWNICNWNHALNKYKSSKQWSTKFEQQQKYIFLLNFTSFVKYALHCL